MQVDQLKRREFITLLGGVAMWPIMSRAQQADRVRKLGFLGAATSSVGGPWLSALVQRLGELGWVEGRNLRIEVRWAEGRNDRATEIAIEFSRADLET
jgi:putative ABC transport system substrate-binding protein